MVYSLLPGCLEPKWACVRVCAQWLCSVNSEAPTHFKRGSPATRQELRQPCMVRTRLAHWHWHSIRAFGFSKRHVQTWHDWCSGSLTADVLAASRSASAAILFFFPRVTVLLWASRTSEEGKGSHELSASRREFVRQASPTGGVEARFGVLTREEGRRQAEQTGDQVQVLGSLLLFGGWSNDWRRWFTFKLGRARVRHRPPATPPLVVFIQRAWTLPTERAWSIRVLICGWLKSAHVKATAPPRTQRRPGGNSISSEGGI